MAITPSDPKYMNTERYVLCYFDVLGVKSNVKTKPQIIYAGLWAACRLLEQYRNNNKSILIRSFSDNFIVAIKCSDKNKNRGLRKVASIVGHVSADLANACECYVRGSITYGELHIDKKNVIGPGLIKAYELENNNSRYPRIIIDNTAFSISSYKKLKISDNKLFFADSDGEIVVNFLACISLEEEKQFIPFMLGGLYRNYNHPDLLADSNIKEKFIWLKKYYTQFLRGNGLGDNIPDNFDAD